MTDLLERLAIDLRYAAADCPDSGTATVLNEMAGLLEALAQTQ